LPFSIFCRCAEDRRKTKEKIALKLSKIEMSLKEKVMDLTVKRTKTLSTQLFSKTRAKLPRTREDDSPSKRASGGKAALSKAAADAVEAGAAGSREAANHHQERKAVSSSAKKSSKPKAATAGAKRAASASKPVGAAEAEATAAEDHRGGARSPNMQPTSGTATRGGDKGESTDGRSTEEPRMDSKMAAVNKDDEKNAGSGEMGKIFPRLSQCCGSASH
jgi:hypothetical protein